MADIPPVPEEMIDFLQSNFAQEVFSPVHSLHEMIQVNRRQAAFVTEQIWRHGFFTGMAKQAGIESVKYVIVTQEVYDRIQKETT